MNRRFVRRVLVLGLAAALAPGTVAADEGETPPDGSGAAAAARFREAATSMPGPGPRLAFDWEGDFVVGDRPMGPVRFTARPVEVDGVWHWRVRDAVDLGPTSVEGTGLLRPDLTVVEAEARRVDPGAGPRTIRVTRRGDRLVVTSKPNAGEPAVEEVENPGPAFVAWSAVVLFGRHALASEPATYEGPMLHLKDAGRGEALVRPIRITTGPGRLEGRRVDTVRVARDTEVWTLAFDPDDRAFLGAEVELRGGVGARLVPRGAAGERVPEDVLRQPAREPAVAAARALLAVITGDADLFVEAAHLPTLRAADAEAGRIAEDITDEAYEKRVREAREREYARRGRSEPAERVEPNLRAVLGVLEVRETGEDRATVTFPEGIGSAGGLRVDVVRDGDVWYFTRIY